MQFKEMKVNIYGGWKPATGICENVPFLDVMYTGGGGGRESHTFIVSFSQQKYFEGNPFY